MPTLTRAQTECLQVYAEGGLPHVQTRTLRKLVAEGLLRPVHSTHGYRRFTHYEITDAGRSFLSASKKVMT